MDAFVAEPFGEEIVGAPRYVTFEPELSADSLVATLPLGGPSTLGSRGAFENLAAHMLSRFLPHAFRAKLEEGLTEPDPRGGPGTVTTWRPRSEPLDVIMARVAAFGGGIDDEP